MFFGVISFQVAHLGWIGNGHAIQNVSTRNVFRRFVNFFAFLANMVIHINDIALAIVPSWAEKLVPTAYSYAYSHLPMPMP